MPKAKRAIPIEFIGLLGAIAAISMFRSDILDLVNRYADENNLQPIPIIGYGARASSGEIEAVVIGPYPYSCHTGTCSGVRIERGQPTTDAVLSTPNRSRHWVEERTVKWETDANSGKFLLARKSDRAPVHWLDKHRLMPALEK